MPKNKTIYHQDHDDENSVYMYYNDKWNIKLFVNADGFDEAMKMFDICDFDNRDEWSIYLEPNIEVNLEQGDMLMYKGCDLEHWRNPFKGENCVQVFLHYNNASSKDAKQNKFDGRPMLGLPAFFK